MRDDIARSIVSAERTAEGLRATLRFAPELSVFAGHFPGHPIVPGIFLIEAVGRALERAGGPRRRIAALHARFRDQVGPGETLEVAATLAETAAGASCRALLSTIRGVAAEIRLELAGEEASPPQAAGAPPAQ